MRDSARVSTGLCVQQTRSGGPGRGGLDRGKDAPGTHRVGLFAARLINVARGYSWSFTSSSLSDVFVSKRIFCVFQFVAKGTRVVERAKRAKTVREYSPRCFRPKSSSHLHSSFAQSRSTSPECCLGKTPSQAVRPQLASPTNSGSFRPIQPLQPASRSVLLAAYICLSTFTSVPHPNPTSPLPHRFRSPNLRSLPHPQRAHPGPHPAFASPLGTQPLPGLSRSHPLYPAPIPLQQSTSQGQRRAAGTSSMRQKPGRQSQPTVPIEAMVST